MSKPSFRRPAAHEQASDDPNINFPTKAPPLTFTELRISTALRLIDPQCQGVTANQLAEKVSALGLDANPKAVRLALERMEKNGQIASGYGARPDKGRTPLLYRATPEGLTAHLESIAYFQSLAAALLTTAPEEMTRRDEHQRLNKPAGRKSPSSKIASKR